MNIYNRFGAKCCFRVEEYLGPEDEAARYFETSLNIWQITDAISQKTSTFTVSVVRALNVTCL
jgi:hypothetical protein